MSMFRPHPMTSLPGLWWLTHPGADPAPRPHAVLVRFARPGCGHAKREAMQARLAAFGDGDR